jgi:hypothetical protein
MPDAFSITSAPLANHKTPYAEQFFEEMIKSVRKLSYKPLLRSLGRCTPSICLMIKGRHGLHHFATAAPIHRNDPIKCKDDMTFRDGSLIESPVAETRKKFKYAPIISSKSLPSYMNVLYSMASCVRFTPLSRD